MKVSDLMDFMSMLDKEGEIFVWMNIGEKGEPDLRIVDVFDHKGDLIIEVEENAHQRK